MAKGQKRTSKEPKKASKDIQKTKKLAGPKYLREATSLTPAVSRIGSGGKKS